MAKRMKKVIKTLAVRAKLSKENSDLLAFTAVDSIEQAAIDHGPVEVFAIMVKPLGTIHMTPVLQVAKRKYKPRAKKADKAEKPAKVKKAPKAPKAKANPTGVDPVGGF